MAKAKTIVRKMDSEIEAGYGDMNDKHEMTVIERVEKVMKMKSKAEKLAESDLYVIRWMYPDARKAFPNEPWMRYVDKYFPYAKDLDGKTSPLLIDEPRYEDDLKKCERKREFLKKLGYRYLIIKPLMTIEQCYEELDRCQTGPISLRQ